MRKPIIIFLIFQLIVFGGLHSQAFLRSTGLQLFNESKYQAAVDSMQSWLDSHTSEKGLIQYYMGESYYHLCFSANEMSRVKSHLDEAVKLFSEALSSSDINTRFTDRIPVIQYKLGWCYYRKAELAFNPVEHLNKAIEYFDNQSADDQDETGPHPLIMNGICALEIARYHHITIWQSENTGYANLLRNEALLHLRKAETQLKTVSLKTGIDDLQFNSVQYILHEIDLQTALIYLTTPSDQFDKIKDSKKQSNVYETVNAILNQQNLSVLYNQFRQPSAEMFRRMTMYLQARKKLLQYFITDEAVYYQSLIEMIEKWPTGFLQSEKQLIEGMRDFNSPVTDNRFLSLFKNKNNPLYRVSEVIPEAYYWLGWISFFVKPLSADQLFNEFLEKTVSQSDFRIQFLREDAQLRQLRTRFDQNIDQRNQLQQLKNDLQKFNPVSSFIESERKQLYQMVRISIGESIWNEVLESRNRNERLDEAIESIQEFMKFATQVTGHDRELYLNNLNRIFRITAPRRSRQTTFYRGMALFLEAEIQERALSKKRMYQTAADTLAQCEGMYKDEADYIRGRSYFASIKHIEDEAQKSEMIEKAKSIFIRLINEKENLRSLYYLAELYRIEGNHLAAITCYDKVIEYTKNDADGSFWYNNAIAAKASCQDQGNARVLDDIAIHEVKFPDAMLVIDGQVISLEKFADRDYLIKDHKEQAIDTWIHLGHPVRSIYPSVNQLPGSYFRRNTFDNPTMQIQERLGKVTAGVRFEVLTEIHLDSIRVFINDEETIRHPSGYYEKSPLPLHHAVVIRIHIPGHYLYEKQMLVYQPGIQRFVAAPIKRREVMQVNIDSSRLSLQIFDQRFDQFAFNPNAGFIIHKSSLLFEAFINNIKLRDIVYSESYHGFLVPNSEGAVQYFKNDPMLTPSEPLELDLPEHLAGFSPEGLVTDAEGNLYISDWKHHHIVTFDRSGAFVRTMGDYGVNTQSDVTDPEIRLQYPARLFLVESGSYFTPEGFPVYKSDLFFVCDANGIHMMDENGNFLQTVISNEAGITDLTLLSAEKKDAGFEIRVYNRLNQDVLGFRIL